MGKKKHSVKRQPDNSSQNASNTPEKRTLYSTTRTKVYMVLFLAFVVFVLYSNSLESPFIFDDLHNILDNPHIHLTELSLEGLISAGFQSPSNRPVANISFALNYYFHEYNIMGYHLVNVLIHITTGILLYFFVKFTLNMPSFRFESRLYHWIPFFTALIWLVHPIQTQSVTYIVQRMNSMAAMFYVLSLLLYVTARRTSAKRKKWFLFSGCIISALLALGSKEIAATLPLMIFLYEWYFFQDLSKTWLKNHRSFLISVMILVLFVAFLFLGPHPVEKIVSSYNLRDFDLTQRVLTQFRVMIFYLSLLIFPHPTRLNVEHDFPLSHSLFDPLTTIFSMGIVMGLFGLSLFIAKKQRILSFCILWFLGNLVIESSVIPLEIVFEHRLYLPSMLIILVTVTAVIRYLKPTWLGMGLLFFAVILFSSWTFERNAVWRDPEILWRDCIEKSPQKARPYCNLGTVLMSQGRLDEAIGFFSEALRLKPKYDKVHSNMGMLFLRQGRLNEAMDHCLKAFKIKPDSLGAHNTMGSILAAQGRLDEAITHYSEALRIKPDSAESHQNMGNVLLRQRKFNEAIDHYVEALRIKPDYAEAHKAIGFVLAAQGRLDEAITHYSEALRIKPDNAEIHQNMGNVLLRQRKFNEAIDHYVEALRIRPDYAEVHNALGAIFASQGRLDEAITHYSEALRIRPDFTPAKNNLDKALANQNQIE